jgi:hypothetical protein
MATKDAPLVMMVTQSRRFVDRLRALLSETSRGAEEVGNQAEEVYTGAITREAVQPAIDAVRPICMSREQLCQLQVQQENKFRDERQSLQREHEAVLEAVQHHYESLVKDVRLHRTRCLQALHSVRSDLQLASLAQRQRSRHNLSAIEQRMHAIASTRGDQELATAQEKVASARSDIFLHVLGTLLASLAGVFGFLRLMYG